MRTFPPIILITGKGGVGKSFVSALMARKMADSGKKVLLVEMGSWSYFHETFNISSDVAFEPISSGYGFDLALWRGEDCLEDYIRYIIKLPWLSQAFLKNAWMRSLIPVAPGLREISFLGKLTSGVRRHGPALDYDHIIVDGVSSGHFLSLLQAPRGLSQVVSTGPLHSQSKSIFEVLSNSEFTQCYIVSNLERYPVQEAFELKEQVEKSLGQEIKFITNKVYQIPQPGKNYQSDEAKNFIQIQEQLRSFQEKQIKKVGAEAKQVFSIPHYFTDLEEAMGEQNAKLFE